MTLELRKDCKYSMLVATSMGTRITPENGQPVHSSDKFTLYATSAETNVASISSYLGLPVKVLTTFVKGSPIAGFIKSNLRARHMDYEGPEVEQGIRGDIVIRLILQTVVTDLADLAFLTTVQEKLEEH